MSASPMAEVRSAQDVSSPRSSHQDEVVATAVRLINAGGDPKQVLDVVYCQARMQGLCEMAKLAARLKQNSERKVA